MKLFKNKKSGNEQGAFPRSQGSRNTDQQFDYYDKRSEAEYNGGNGNNHNSARNVEIGIAGNGTFDDGDTLPSQEDIEVVSTGCYPTKNFNYCNNSNKKKKKKKNRSRGGGRGQHGEEQDNGYDGYDQQQQQHAKKKRRTMYGLIGLFCMLFIVGVFLFFWFLMRRNNNHTDTTRDRDTPRTPDAADNIFEEQLDEEDLTRLQQLRDILSDTLLESDGGLAPLYDSSSPQYDALVWVAVHDPVRLDFNDDDESNTHMIQERYGIVLLYFAFSGTDWWKQHNFLSVYSVCDWNDNGTDDDSFEGIKCDDSGSVTEIRLDMNRLKGAFPIEITTFLPNLRVLGLGSNSISGTIPKEIGGTSSNWKNTLEWLNLGSNEFTGTIPIEIASLSNLKGLLLCKFNTPQTLSFV